MRFLYIGAFRMPCNDAAAQRVVSIGKILRACGHEVSYLSYGGMYRDEDRQPDGSYWYNGFGYVITHELDGNGFLERALQWWCRGKATMALLENWVDQYDAIICYNADRRLSEWLIAFCRRAKKCLISDITEWYDNNELHFYQRHANDVNMRRVQPRIPNKIVISTALECFYHEGHNIVVPATCDLAEPKWAVATSDKRGEHPLTFIYAGSPVRKDLLHVAINAIQRLIDEGCKVRFDILGVTRDAYLRQARKVLCTQALAPEIVFHGRVPHEQVPAFYRSADFMLLLREPTRKNTMGFPTKFTEAMASGTPVVANLTSDLGAYLLDSSTGFAVPEPTEESFYRVLREKVVSLGADDISRMHNAVLHNNATLDYRHFIQPMQAFIDTLQ